MTKQQEYETQILEWRAKKYDELVRENGWLALAGLSWLKEGRNLIGANPLCEIELPEHAPTFLGIIEKKGKPIHFHANSLCRLKANELSGGTGNSRGSEWQASGQDYPEVQQRSKAQFHHMASASDGTPRTRR